MVRLVSSLRCCARNRDSCHRYTCGIRDNRLHDNRNTDVFLYLHEISKATVDVRKSWIFCVYCLSRADTVFNSRRHVWDSQFDQFLSPRSMLPMMVIAFRAYLSMLQ